MEVGKLTKREQDVMEILWHAHHQMSASEIQAESDDVSIYTIQQVLHRLLKREYIHVSGYGQSVKVIMRYYEPVLSEAEYIDSFIELSTAQEIAKNFIRKSDDPAQLQEMKEMIEKKEKELKK